MGSMLSAVNWSLSRWSVAEHLGQLNWLAIRVLEYIEVFCFFLLIHKSKFQKIDPFIDVF